MTSGTQDTRLAGGLTWRPIAALIAVAVALLFVGANAHLVYVAVESQPDCVPHEKSVNETGTYRAARSAC